MSTHRCLSLGVIGCYVVAIYAGAVTQGGACSLNGTRLDTGTHRMLTDCADKYFCSDSTNGTGTCVPRQCRRDEFPYGYDHKETLPPLCARETFCPDEGSGCTSLRAVGQPCQLNRDEQCASPPNWHSAQPLESHATNGSICLQGICMYANATAGSPCVLENTTYTEVDSNARQVVINIIRDNCRSGFFCHPTDMVCEHAVDNGLPCVTNRNCRSHNCGAGLCADSIGTPFKVPAWQIVLTALLLIGAMTSTCLCLTLLHKRHRLERDQETREYYYEQISLRQSIIALHAAAANKYGYKEDVL
ncbi:hypothetical protein BV22DRAFT_1067208, partial [Leucogyrophana mollusca]